MIAIWYSSCHHNVNFGVSKAHFSTFFRVLSTVEGAAPHLRGTCTQINATQERRKLTCEVRVKRKFVGRREFVGGGGRKDGGEQSF
jgi:hypothetical protein